MKNFKIIPLLFNDVPKKGSKISENIRYGLLFGRCTLVKYPLLVHYSGVIQIIKVLESICLPNQKVAFISDPGQDIIKVHSSEFEWKVAYYGTKPDMDKFKKVLTKDNKLAEKPGKKIVQHLIEEIDGEDEINEYEEKSEKDSESNDELKNDENSATTSNTPSKSVLVSFTTPENSSKHPRTPATTSPVIDSDKLSKLDDSGFLECKETSLKTVSKSLSFECEVNLIAKNLDI